MVKQKMLFSQLDDGVFGFTVLSLLFPTLRQQLGKPNPFAGSTAPQEQLCAVADPGTIAAAF